VAASPLLAVAFAPSSDLPLVSARARHRVISFDMAGRSAAAPARLPPRFIHSAAKYSNVLLCSLVTASGDQQSVRWVGDARQNCVQMKGYAWPGQKKVDGPKNWHHYSGLAKIVLVRPGMEPEWPQEHGRTPVGGGLIPSHVKAP
jgi:hypothetical protein